MLASVVPVNPGVTFGAATVCPSAASFASVSSQFAIEVPDSLVRAARAGELPAFERLFRLFERPAWTLATRLLADSDAARDVVQEAMLQAFDRIDRYRFEAPFWAWLRQIVVNAALMRLRSRRHLTSLDDDEIALPSALTHDPIGVMDGMADSVALERALAQLPATTRSVLWLYCVEGYSHVEIAALNGQSVSFSKSQVARGLARLRQWLGVVEEVCHVG